MGRINLAERVPLEDGDEELLNQICDEIFLGIEVEEHQLHGADGRFVKHHAERKLTTLAAARVDAEGGFTLDPIYKPTEPGSKGYALSVTKGAEEIHPASLSKAEKAKVIREYAHKHFDKLREPDAYVGGWVDKDKFYLDISTVVQDRQKAIDLGKENSQEAIFDLENGKAIFMEDE